MTKGAFFNINSLNKKKRPFFHFLLHESSIKVPITNDKLKGLCTAMYSKAKKKTKKKDEKDVSFMLNNGQTSLIHLFRKIITIEPQKKDIVKKFSIRKEKI